MRLFRTAASIVTIIIWASSAAAQVTTSYKYDATGRLTETKKGADASVNYVYDAADNRVGVYLNQGPTAYDDYEYDFRSDPGPYTFWLDPTANDADPNFPADELTVTSISGSYGGTLYDGVILYYGSAGSMSWTYTVRDRAGLTSTATAYLDIEACVGC